MKLNKIALALGSLLVSGSALAEISANLGVTTNYVWRGVSQTDDSAALSGGVDYAHDSGFYVGVWGSNVDFVDVSGNQVEIDLYGGFANEVAGFGYDVGVLHYAYPQADQPAHQLDFTEVYLGLSYGPVSGGVHYTVDKESNPADENDVYYYLSAGTEIMDGWSISGTAGYYDFDGPGASGYAHYQADLGKTFGEFGDLTLSVSTVDDDSSGTKEDTIVFLSWAKTFE